MRLLFLSDTIWALTIFLSFDLLCNAQNPQLFVITGPGENLYGVNPSACRDLVSINATTQTKLETLPLRILFGKEGNTLVLLSHHYSTNKYPFWVIDCPASVIVKTGALINVQVQMRLREIENLLVVGTNESKAFFPGMSRTGTNFAAIIASVDLHSGKTDGWQPANVGRANGKFVKTPTGIGFSYHDRIPNGYGYILELCDLNLRKTQEIILPNSDLHTDNDVYQIIYLPGVGLMEYFQQALFRLTDANLSTNIPAERIPLERVDSDIYAQDLNGHPCLIWGESDKVPRSYGDVSSLVVYDWAAKNFLLRKTLKTHTTTFRVSNSGNKIFFIDAASGAIEYLDIKSELVAPFGDNRIANAKGAVIIEAN